MTDSANIGNKKTFMKRIKDFFVRNRMDLPLVFAVGIISFSIAFISCGFAK